MANDPVVAAHFRDFNLAALRIVRLQTERFVHVSYRLHNDVFWTRKQLRLPPGENLITDGTYSARTRCGNRTSIVPQAKTSPSEPSVQELETPQPPQLYSALSPVLPSTLNDIPSFETAPPPAPAASESTAPGGVAGGVPVGGLLYPPLLPGGAAGAPIGGVVSPTLPPGGAAGAPIGGVVSPTLPPGGAAGIPIGGVVSPTLPPGGAAGVPIGGVVSPTLPPGNSHFPSPCDPTKDRNCPIPPAIPEPGTWLLVAPGLVYLFYRWTLRASGR